MNNHKYFLDLMLYFNQEIEKSMKKYLWYFRPSHTRLMKDWRNAIDIYENYESLPHKEDYK